MVWHGPCPTAPPSVESQWLSFLGLGPKDQLSRPTWSQLVMIPTTCAGTLTSEGGLVLVSKPSQTSTVRVLPALRSSCTASPCVSPSRLCWFTSSSRKPTRRRPSRPAAPVGLTCKNTRPCGADRPALGPFSTPLSQWTGLDSHSPHLGDEDALVSGVTGVARVALGAPTDADAQLLPGGLLDTELPHAWGRRVPPHQQDQF